jgi:hypothetical protein
MASPVRTIGPVPLAPPWEGLSGTTVTVLPCSRREGCGSGMTCWRPEEWHEAGVRDRLRKMMLDRLGRADEIER